MSTHGLQALLLKLIPMFVRILLSFWNELAHAAFQHLEKGTQIYVCGRLIADTVETEDGTEQTYYKVFFWLLGLTSCYFMFPLVGALLRKITIIAILWQVNVKQLNFIERSWDSNSETPGNCFLQDLYLKRIRFIWNVPFSFLLRSLAGKKISSASREELWQAFFANPADWWDNRKDKVSYAS